MDELTHDEDDEGLSTPAKVVIVVSLVLVALVAFSMTLEEGPALDKLIFAVAGVGSVALAWKTALA